MKQTPEMDAVQANMRPGVIVRDNPGCLFTVQ